MQTGIRNSSHQPWLFSVFLDKIVGDSSSRSYLSLKSTLWNEYLMEIDMDLLHCYSGLFGQNSPLITQFQPPVYMARGALIHLIDASFNGMAVSLKLKLFLTWHRWRSWQELEEVGVKKDDGRLHGSEFGKLSIYHIILLHSGIFLFYTAVCCWWGTSARTWVWVNLCRSWMGFRPFNVG